MDNNSPYHRWTCAWCSLYNTIHFTATKTRYYKKKRFFVQRLIQFVFFDGIKKLFFLYVFFLSNAYEGVLMKKFKAKEVEFFMFGKNNLNENFCFSYFSFSHHILTAWQYV